MREGLSWVILFVIALLLIIIGFEGSLGKILGCILTPSEVVINPEAQAIGNF
jgi:hypothetical protein